MKAYVYILYNNKLKVEKYLKQMKSRKFVELLKDNPEKWNWIIDRL
jgi:hypothetical protein